MARNFSIAIAMFACLAIGLAATISGARDVEERITDRQDRRDDIAEDIDDNVEDRQDRRDDIADDVDDNIESRRDRRREILD